MVSDFNGQVLHLIWTTQDILDAADDMGLELSHLDALKVLREISENYDPNVGVNWDIIEEFITHRFL